MLVNAKYQIDWNLKLLFQLACLIYPYQLYMVLSWKVAGNANQGGYPKIVGGTATTIDEVPYLINLRLNGRFICGGALITPNCVLTAAHCVRGTSPADLTVHAGSSLLSVAGETRSVQQHFTSPLFTPNTLDMDVAILRISNAMSGSNIATIPLCSMKPSTGELVKISGWGVTDENSRDPPDQVRTANVRVISIADCRFSYVGSATLTSTMFCATVPGAKDSCSGDSGGPVVYNGKVCGIVSWGIGCARAKYPGVYTNVSSRRVNAFVKQIIADSC